MKKTKKEIEDALIQNKEFFKTTIDWNRLSQVKGFTENIYREFEDKWIWYCVSNSGVFSKSFIREFKNKLDLSVLVKRNFITEKEKGKLQNCFKKALLL